MINNNSINNNNDNNNDNPPVVLIYRVGIRRGIVMPHGPVGNLPGDGLSIKILVTAVPRQHYAQHE